VNCRAVLKNHCLLAGDVFIIEDNDEGWLSLKDGEVDKDLKGARRKPAAARRNRSLSPEEVELQGAIEAILDSQSPKKLVIAGPGTGKTSLFKKILKLTPGNSDQRVVLTFINNLRNDLENDLGDLAQVFTLHSFCLSALYRNAKLRGSLSSSFRCFPGLASLIANDWKVIEKSEAPHFVGEMRSLAQNNNIKFYLDRGNYYDAVDFDDSVFRAYKGFESRHVMPSTYALVLIDEYQDFNRLEAGIIDNLSKESPILIAGDDDQALYSQLRDASWDHIRFLNKAGEYEVHKLPFCMRCPKVVVEAVGDILTKAQELRRLEGRIDKPFKHFPLAKGVDSAKYPKIANVRTSVQSMSVNYMGRFIAREIAAIPEDEVTEAREGAYPVALVIVARPYRNQIIQYLEAKGFSIDTRAESRNAIERDIGLSILKEDLDSNLGWRIILHIDQPSFIGEAIAASADCATRLVDTIPTDYREIIMAEVDAYEKSAEREVSRRGEELDSETSPPPVRVTSFEGAKGLSAQHVFIVGLHDGELPRNPTLIKDIEICKFIVGLTRTRKKCTLIHTGHFGDNWMSRSSFISWINDEKLDNITVDRAFWDSIEPSDR
jgi:superfamily I DNA/RNA helicase